MNMKKSYYIILIGIALLVIGGAFYVVFMDKDGGSVATPAPTPEMQVPNLDRPITFPDFLPPEAIEARHNAIASIREALQGNPDQIDYWLELGILQKQLEDYEGAREAWEYAAFIRPDDARAYNNLADLHAYYLHDNQKAEEYFLKTIEKSPASMQYYTSAFGFYINALKDKEKARLLLLRGIKDNPDSSKVLQDMLWNIDSY
ncbi:MAG: hypothetical protein HY445_01220 [Candidatus Niyogibacteria bacterium]|nr:hypothetical protein [Candidatus Niyogibacteria bacterium]